MSRTKAEVFAAQESLVVARVLEGAVRMNEVGYIDVGTLRLEAEVVRIRGDFIDMQVYEDTDGVKLGDPVELTGELLCVELGPGLLGNVFDGLQNPLRVLAERDGFFLRRGQGADALDRRRKWEFTPSLQIAETCRAGDVLGTVQERHFTHKIFAPFDLQGEASVLWIRSGMFFVDEAVAALQCGTTQREVSLVMRWPVRMALSEPLLRARTSEQHYPRVPLFTGQRIIDTFFPIARGGTACIPGPFGAGKTVLQQLIARYAGVDIVIIVACGERAGEVVETITEYPELTDPKTGHSLMSRTIIVCNTSSMPVASRESSIYTGLTLGEYYRQMGYDVLLLADSTSRWAQAMREISGRLEEIPGEEAFPAYLESKIKGVYERGGVVTNNAGEEGSLTMIGTVSPAGGNFEEPVTQATLGTVKTFLGLSYDRAYKRFYPAIDPLQSWSRYFDQLSDWFADHLHPDWLRQVEMMMQLLERGEAIDRMMKVAGEEGVSLSDRIIWHKARMFDAVYLQQDAFDDNDAARPIDQQYESFMMIRSVVEAPLHFKTFEQMQRFFTEITALYKNLNYAPFESEAYREYQNKIIAMVADNEVAG